VSGWLNGSATRFHVSNTQKVMTIDDLVQAVKEQCIYCGEVISGKNATDFILEIENQVNVTFTDSEIVRALREGAEQFVDSMQQNEHDTEEWIKDGLYDGFPIDTLETRLARWEALRPSVIRAKHLASIVG
jgi:hypothetical protein